jgi:hypothetical protein
MWMLMSLQIPAREALRGLQSLWICPHCTLARSSHGHVFQYTSAHFPCKYGGVKVLDYRPDIVNHFFQNRCINLVLWAENKHSHCSTKICCSFQSIRLAWLFIVLFIIVLLLDFPTCKWEKWEEHLFICLLALEIYS